MVIQVEKLHDDCGKRLADVRVPLAYLSGTGIRINDRLFCNGCGQDYLASELEVNEVGILCCPTQEAGAHCEYPAAELVSVKDKYHLVILRQKAAPQFPFEASDGTNTGLF